MASLLILGGARSGKSRYAQQRAEAYPGERSFIATAFAFDSEMTERIALHRADRDESWRTIEAPYDLVDAIGAEDGPGRVILVDCLTLWLSNLLLAERDMDHAIAQLADCLRHTHAQIVVVANEVGFGIVPDNALARRFRDAAGRANQAIASMSKEVVLIVAGLPIVLQS